MSTIPPISTKRTITSHFNSMNTKNITYTVGNVSLVLGQAQTCDMVKPVNDTHQTSSSILVFATKPMIILKYVINVGLLSVNFSHFDLFIKPQT